MDSVFGRLLILTYHRVLQFTDELFPTNTDAVTFERHVISLKRHFHVMNLAAAVKQLTCGTLPSRTVAITFDDGYRDNFSVALPILTRHNLSATFFIATGYLDGGRMWNDTLIESIRSCRTEQLDLRELDLGIWPLRTAAERAAMITALLSKLKYFDQDDRIRKAAEIAELTGSDLPNDLMMSSDQVRELHRQGMHVGAHTVTHPILTRVSTTDAKKEIVNSRNYLADLTKSPVTSFAYPNGIPTLDFNKSHIGMVRDAGFQIAVSTAFGPVGRDFDPLQLARVGPWDRSSWKFGLRLLRWYCQPPPPMLD